MAYFISGFKASAHIVEAFGPIFKTLVPSPLAYFHARRIGSGSSFLINYSADKIIPDIEVIGKDQSSWLALIGTPLLNLKSELQKQEFLSEFLAKPADILRHEMDGNFAALAYDAEKDEYIFASDFNNSTPIFYSISPVGVLISSHELALARFLKPEIDPFGFYQMINLGVTWDSRTRFINIYKTLPCQVIFIDAKKALKTESYWRPLDEKPWQVSFNEAIDKWLSIFKVPIWDYFGCSNRKPVVSDFTAGEDSRLILAQCHALEIPFTAYVAGTEDSIDVIVARRTATKLGFDLIVSPRNPITAQQLLSEAIRISLNGDGYQEFTASCTEVVANELALIDDYRVVKYCGAPGGEAFRGSYYLRGKAFFPSRKVNLDYRFFTRIKYLLDFHAGLLLYPNDAGLEEIYETVKSQLREVEGFPIGTQIDHLLRVFQTCFLGLKYQNPLYLPFATKNLTRSIYSIPPYYKKGGRLTKACTEILYPELAFIRTQNGVPTIRRTLLRQPLFLPEYISTMKKISSGAVSRLLKWTRDNKWYFSQAKNMYIFTSLLKNPPYCGWLSSATAMKTGYLYNQEVLNPILSRAKKGSCRFLPILGRIISQELLCRWVYSEDNY